MPIEPFLLALTTFFAAIGPADVAFVFAALTKDATPRQRMVFATRGVLVATFILVFFAFFGDAILSLFGVSLPALRTAGGILLLLISIDMVFARHSGGTGTTDEEEAEADLREDISVFPIAMPLLAGPGAISAIILLTTGSESSSEYWAVVAALGVIMLASWGMLMTAIPLQRLLGVTGLSVVSRVVGILLAALSVQFIFDGIASSGILKML